MLIHEMTMEQFSEGLERSRSLVLPFGSIEEHGPHLPLATDTLQVEAIAQRLAKQRYVFIAPAIPYGVCRSSREHPGTISITTATLKNLACDLVRDFYRQGLRCFVLISGHAGGTHLASLVDAGEMLLDELPDIQIAVLNEFMLAGNSCDDIIETPGDSHAGEIETSRLLYTHPELVKNEQIPPAEFPQFPERGVLVRDKRLYWPGGVWGDPEKGSHKKGQELVERLVSALDRLLTQLEERAENNVD